MGRQMGKSFSVSVFCLYWAFFVPGQKIVIVSSTMRQAENLFRIVKGLLESAPVLSSCVRDSFVTRVRFDNGSEIVAMPTGVDGHTIRGLTASVLVLEESAFIKGDIVDEVVMPMVAALDALGSRKKVIQISTPVGRNHFWSCFREGSGYACHHYSFVDGLRVGQYDSGFIEAERRRLSSSGFLREYGAEFTENSRTAFPWDVVQSCVVQEERVPSHFDLVQASEGRFSVGYDIGRFGSRAVFAVVREFGGRFKLVYYKELARASYAVQLDWLARLCEFFNPSFVCVDSTGQGLPVLESIRGDARLKGFRVKPVVFSVRSKSDMASWFRKLLEDKKIVLPSDDVLLNQLVDQEHSLQSGTGLDVYSCPEGGFDDVLWSLLLACWGFKRGGEFLAYSATVK